MSRHPRLLLPALLLTSASLAAPSEPVVIPLQGSVPITDPVIVNVDPDDPKPEIVFTDSDGKIRVLDETGADFPGYPRSAGSNPSALAVGYLEPGVGMMMVWGTDDGRLRAIDYESGLVPTGFPVDLGLLQPVYVSIGALGGPDMRNILAVTDYKVFVVRPDGSIPVGWAFTDAVPATPSVGDLDADGTPEIVIAVGNTVYAVHSDSYAKPILATVPGKYFVSKPVIGDLDRDGTLEVVVGTLTGDIYAFEHDGSIRAGFPWSFSAGQAHGLALSHFVGGFNLEIAGVSSLGDAVILFDDGTPQSAYPFHVTDGGFSSEPVIHRVSSTHSANVLAAGYDSLWALGNLGGYAPGFPIQPGGLYRTAPALGDLGNDLDVDYVAVSSLNILIQDTGIVPYNGVGPWGMAGGDPMRTGCHKCPEVFPDPTGIEDLGRMPGVTVGLPAPNPARSAGTRLAYSLESPAHALVTVHDVRGRRVRLLLSERLDGAGTIRFDGLDDHGARLPAGVYFFRLDLEGEDAGGVLTRKFQILR